MAYHLHVNERAMKSGETTWLYFFSRDICPEKAVAQPTADRQSRRRRPVCWWSSGPPEGVRCVDTTSRAAAHRLHRLPECPQHAICQTAANRGSQCIFS